MKNMNFTNNQKLKNEGNAKASPVSSAINILSSNYPAYYFMFTIGLTDGRAKVGVDE